MTKSTNPLLHDRQVLLVDDESMVLMLVEDMLRAMGAARVETAMSLEEGQQAARHLVGLDVAVLDVNLSGRASYPIAEILTERHVPFIFATGYGTEGHEWTWKQTVTVTKPFGRQELERALAAVLPT